MNHLNRERCIQRMNKWGGERKPFYFIINYSRDKCILIPEKDLENSGIRFSFKNNDKKQPSKKIKLQSSPVKFEDYCIAFNKVRDEIQKGNSFLTNLTFKTPVETKLSLEEIYEYSLSKFKLLVPNKFVVFSPEPFLKIKDGSIYSYPMKGTIDASVEDAKNKILKDKKEIAEHATIVDLIRNDLSIIARSVTVPKFRYISEIVSGQGNLLQVSSEIKGLLPKNYSQNLGNLLFSLLPAGSISGAPKKKTLEIIDNAENYERGFYTGVAGYFDGENMESFVLIRYIEKDKNGKYFYKSGGGITHLSDPKHEYEEMTKKIYVPIP